MTIQIQSLHVVKTFSMDFLKVRIINLFDDFLDNIILPDYSVSRKLFKKFIVSNLGKPIEKIIGQMLCLLQIYPHNVN